MIEEWNRFKGWSVLEYFLLYPNSRVHINQLSRNLKISLQTAQRFCVSYHKEGLLNKAEVGNVHQFWLNESDSRVRALLRFMGPYLAADRLGIFLGKNNNVLSVSIYGSFAAGDYGDGSDLDLLVITSDERKPDLRELRETGLRIGKEINILSMSLARWRGMERENDRFFISVKKNSVTLWGGPL